jgi:4-amino-4-deoxy-L-arabinose transferase-like glycosyltransferase
MVPSRKVIWVTALAVTTLWFALLGNRALYDPDEGRYAEIPREMIGGDWVIPHLNGLTYLEKPPLQYWITATMYRVFGVGEVTARLWTGISGWASMWLVFLVATRLWGLGCGLKALMLCAGSSLFVLLGHQLTLDMSLSFFLLAALASFVMAQANRGPEAPWRLWMLGCWAAMACAVLTKGLIGVLIPGATLVLYGSLQGDRDMFKRLNIRWGLPLFLGVAGPWFVLAAHANSQFFQFFFIREHFQRYLTPIEQRTEPWWFFIAVLIVGILPWIPLALHALWVHARRSVPRGEFDAARVLWVWSVFILVFFSLSDSKLIPYILPMVPALALLSVSPKVGGGRTGVTLGALLSLAAALGVAGYLSALWSHGAGRALALELRPTLIGTSVILLLAALGGFVAGLRQRVVAGQMLLCGGWLMASFSILVAAGGAERLFSARDIARAIRAEGAGAGVSADQGVGASTRGVFAPVFAVQAYDQSLAFYLRQPVILVDYQDEFALGLGEAPERGIATLKEFGLRWRELGDGFAVMSRTTYERLRVEGVPMRAIETFPHRVLVRRQ